MTVVRDSELLTWLEMKCHTGEVKGRIPAIAFGKKLQKRVQKSAFASAINNLIQAAKRLFALFVSCPNPINLLTDASPLSSEIGAKAPEHQMSCLACGVWSVVSK